MKLMQLQHNTYNNTLSHQLVRSLTSELSQYNKNDNRVDSFFWIDMNLSSGLLLLLHLTTRQLIPYLLFYCLSFVFVGAVEYVGKPECHPNVTNLKVPQFERFSKTSKYGIGKAKTANATFEEAKKYCESNGMLLGMVKTMDDYRSIAAFLGKKDPKCEKPTQMNLIGSYKLANSSTWMDVDGTPTSFQLFDTLEPYNGNISRLKFDRDYSVLFCKKRPTDMQGPEIGYVYRDAPDHYTYPLSIICQFRPNTSCFLESDETKVNEDFLNVELDELKPIGNISERQYFIGASQKNWTDAYATCKNESMHMLDFEFSNASEPEELYHLLLSFAKEKKLLSQVVSFFTLGKFSTLFLPGTSEVPFKWQWADEWKVPNDTNVLYSFEKKTPSRHGKCISVGTFWNNYTRFTFSLADCNVVHWFMCYKDGTEKADVRVSQAGRAFHGLQEPLNVFTEWLSPSPDLLLPNMDTMPPSEQQEPPPYTDLSPQPSDDLQQPSDDLQQPPSFDVLLPSNDLTPPPYNDLPPLDSSLPFHDLRLQTSGPSIERYKLRSAFIQAGRSKQFEEQTRPPPISNEHSPSELQPPADHVKMLPQQRFAFGSHAHRPITPKTTDPEKNKPRVPPKFTIDPDIHGPPELVYPEVHVPYGPLETSMDQGTFVPEDPDKPQFPFDHQTLSLPPYPIPTHHKIFFPLELPDSFEQAVYPEAIDHRPFQPASPLHKFSAPQPIGHRLLQPHGHQFLTEEELSIVKNELSVPIKQKTGRRLQKKIPIEQEILDPTKNQFLTPEEIASIVS